MLNKQLIETQKVSSKSQKKLKKTYKKIKKLLIEAKTSDLVDKSQFSKDLTKLEFKLQKHWNFPQNSNKHRYQQLLPECTCPKMDNDELFGLDVQIVSVGCPYHSPRSYNGILVEDGSHVKVMADSSKSINVHLREKDQYTNVVLPSKRIVKVEHNMLYIYDEDDTFLEQLELS